VLKTLDAFLMEGRSTPETISYRL